MSRRGITTRRVSLVQRRAAAYAGPPTAAYATIDAFRFDRGVCPAQERSSTMWWTSLQSVHGQCYRNQYLSAAHHPSDDGEEQWLTWSHEVRVTVPLFQPWRLPTPGWAPLWRFV